MDNHIKQPKLSRYEWETTEKKIIGDELKILQIIAGEQKEIRNIFTLSEKLKIMNVTSEMDSLLFHEILLPVIENVMMGTVKKEKKHELNSIVLSDYAIIKSLWDSYCQNYRINYSASIKKIKKIDKMRFLNQILNMNVSLSSIHQTESYEIQLLYWLNQIIQLFCRSEIAKEFEIIKAVYTFICFAKADIPNRNQILMSFIDLIVPHLALKYSPMMVLPHISYVVEKNTDIIPLHVFKLFSHQIMLFDHFKKYSLGPNCVLYNAPTGTGKTLSPIGLLQTHKVIFVSSARHVGLSLARSAINLSKKVAFGYGCSSISDIKLHDAALVSHKLREEHGDYNGQRVELLICDLSSYSYCEEFMRRYFPLHNIITYWDEPLISIDQETSPIHQWITNFWNSISVPHLVLSSASLPTKEELIPIIEKYRRILQQKSGYTEEEDKIEMNLLSIQTADYRKSVTLYDENNSCISPHRFVTNWEDYCSVVRRLETDQTLLRYIDVSEIGHFITICNRHDLASQSANSYFLNKIENITISRIKDYYLICLKTIQTREEFEQISNALSHIPLKQICPIPTPGNPHSGICLTTIDAKTLTDGPTICLTKNTKRMVDFNIQKSGVPIELLQRLKIEMEKNIEINQKIKELSQQVDSFILLKNKTITDELLEHETKLNQLCNQIDFLRSTLSPVRLPSRYIPNSKTHQEFWATTKEKENRSSLSSISESNKSIAFISSLSIQDTEEILDLNIDLNYKILLLMGVAIFDAISDINPIYNEMIKRLVMEEKMFLIIADAELGVGTNYNFTHGVIGKDMGTLSYHGLLQPLGRIGRNHYQQEYSIRMRNSSSIRNLFIESHSYQANELLRLAGGSF